jgi:heme exporter protein CcmD
MSGIQSWAAMGGYAVYVWPAYAVALGVLGGIAVQSWRHYRASIRELDRLQRTAPEIMTSPR